MATRKGALANGGGAITVRRFRPSDAAGASAALQAAFDSFLHGKKGLKVVMAGLSPENLARTSTDGGKHPTTVAYVAEDQGQIVGYVCGSVNPCGFGTLSLLGVRPRHFRRGVGTRLFKRMMAFWRQRKMRKVSTCVSAHNGKALLFYLKHGFIPVGYQRDHYLEGVDEVILDQFLT